MTISPESLPRLLYFSPDFLRLLGIFHGAWASTDQVVDYSIGHFLKISHEHTHRLTSGVMFGRKAQLLAGLIAKSEHEKKNDLLGALNILRGEIKRDWIAHSYITTTDDKVTFMHRNSGGEYKVQTLTFTLSEFLDHVAKMVAAGDALQRGIGMTKEDLAAFVDAAVSAQ